MLQNLLEIQIYINITDIMAQNFEFLYKLIHLIYHDHLGIIFIGTPISSSFPVIFTVVIDISQSLWDELKKYQTKIMNNRVQWE